MMKFKIHPYEVHLIDEPAYTRGSADNLRRYASELSREGGRRHAVAHGVTVGDPEAPVASVVLLGIGGATAVHRDALAHDGNTCYIAAGDAVFALSLPSLELQWCRKVDPATCFGVYWVEAENCLVTWGELEIRRLTSKGEMAWSVSGADIFTEGFEIHRGYLEVTDFNDDIYRIDIPTGQCRRKGTEI